ncbi:MAG: PEP-CTERM sorting domain-containing protein [Pseudomonadota bacterium]
MNRFNKVALAVVAAASFSAANASTLIFNYSGEVNNLTIPSQYADLYDIWNEDADFNNFYGTIIVENFEQYAVGTHVLNIAASNSPLSLSLVSGLLAGIEGTRQRASGTFLPDNSQVGTSGSLTIVNGAVTGFTWSAIGQNSAALKTFNDRTLGSFPVKIESIEVNVTTGISPLTSLGGGDVLFGQSVRGTGTVVMAAVPEPETYAMLLAGLGVVGFSLRRRLNKGA